MNEVGCEAREPIGIALCVSVIELDTLSFNPPKVAKTLLERLMPTGGSGGREYR